MSALVLSQNFRLQSQGPCSKPGRAYGRHFGSSWFSLIELVHYCSAPNERGSGFIILEQFFYILVGHFFAVCGAF